MFYRSVKLQYETKVDTPDPIVAKNLQPSVGDLEGEIHVGCTTSSRPWTRAAMPSKLYNGATVSFGSFPNSTLPGLHGAPNLRNGLGMGRRRCR